MNGLLVAGVVVPVPGVTVIGPHDAAWANLSAGDGRARHTSWVRQWILHTTRGVHPQVIKPGLGPSGRAERTASYWAESPIYSGAQVAVGSDGVAACLADLATRCAYHATTSNDWSVGVETYQEDGGVIFEAALEATVQITRVGCEALGIPFQIARRKYNGTIIERMRDGGPDCVGIFGHRDQAWDFQRHTSSRGRGDPGDEIYERLIAAGAEPLDFEHHQDLEVWTKRQKALVNLGAQVKVDGVAGMATMAAMRARGFASGRDLDRAIAASAQR